MKGFRNREQAGIDLAAAVAKLGLKEAVVLGLPRGGVMVAAPVAEHLGVAIDIVVVRKLGVPFQPEFGFGAIAERGVRVLDQNTIRTVGIEADEIERVVDSEQLELDRRGRVYRQGRAPYPLEGRTVVIVDDGIATGVTMRAAVESARRGGARSVAVAAPVGAAQALSSLGADRVVCLLVPDHLAAVGNWYLDFDQVSDADVIGALEDSHR